ncbi:MAG: hypothetical protein ABIG96_02750 [Candidatus Micrarchaeota archaeon]
MDEIIAKYPFSEKARHYLARENILGVSEEELAEASGRVLAALRNEQKKKFRNPKMEIVTYVLSRIFLGALNNFSASAKFASVEALNSIALLKTEDEEVVMEIAKEFFPSVTQQEKGKYGIAVLDYLKYGGDLPNEKISVGQVFFERGEFMQLLRRAIEIKIMDISINAKTLPENIKKHVEALALEVDKAGIAVRNANAFKGKYLGLPAMQKVLQGLPEGKRFYGSMSLAIACLKDGLKREEAEQVLVTYARNCGRSTHAYTEKEALATLEWVYRHPTINFSIKTLKEQGLVDANTMAETELQFRKMSAKAK